MPRTPGLPKWDSWKPADWEPADVAAIQALALGMASPDQQKRALTYIVERIAATYDGSFRPGPDGDRITAFAEGKRFVGLQIVKLVKVNLGAFKDTPSEQG